jgi:hypothetical protein
MQKSEGLRLPQPMEGVSKEVKSVPLLDAVHLFSQVGKNWTLASPLLFPACLRKKDTL